MTAKGIFSNLPTLETERLILRKIAIDDAEDLFAYTSDEAVAKYVTWNAHQTIQDTKDFIQFFVGKFLFKSTLLAFCLVFKHLPSGFRQGINKSLLSFSFKYSFIKYSPCGSSP